MMVLEFVGGGDLFTFLGDKSNEVGWDIRLKIALDIAEGMRFLHNVNPPILHRDLKSPNVLINAPKSSNKQYTSQDSIIAKVADFGLSSKLFVDCLSTRTVDNPIWCAPEVIQRKPYSQKADVYSYGIYSLSSFSPSPLFRFLSLSLSSFSPSPLFPFLLSPLPPSFLPLFPFPPLPFPPLPLPLFPFLLFPFIILSTLPPSFPLLPLPLPLPLSRCRSLSSPVLLKRNPFPMLCILPLAGPFSFSFASGSYVCEKKEDRKS